MWFEPLERFQKLFFHTAYHDYYRWRLFERNQAQGTLAAPATVAHQAG